MFGSSFFHALYNIFFVNANQIVPRLWIGNFKSALDKDFITKNNINVIVNCTNDMPFPVLNSPVRTIRIGVDDSLLQKDILLMESYLKKIIPVLEEMYTERGSNILVHCHAGKQRSCIVVAALLYELWKSDYVGREDELREEVISHIISKRPQAFTFGLRVNFFQSFKRFSKVNNTNINFIE